MNKKYKQIRNMIVIALVALGIGLLILVQIVGRDSGLIEWQEPMTMAVRVYQLLVIGAAVLLYITQLYFKKRSLDKENKD